MLRFILAKWTVSLAVIFPYAGYAEQETMFQWEFLLISGHGHWIFCELLNVNAPQNHLNANYWLSNPTIACVFRILLPPILVSFLHDVNHLNAN
jgi:hypothetical protein